mmetsp:Transcript_22308/g.43393  ORF Transcript_22308/g.43393 Transcript_22308/m.43393 type:complete len:216 (-) Transcript_22308:1028-1675(-)
MSSGNAPPQKVSNLLHWPPFSPKAAGASEIYSAAACTPGSMRRLSAPTCALTRRTACITINLCRAASTHPLTACAGRPSRCASWSRAPPMSPLSTRYCALRSRFSAPRPSLGIASSLKSDCIEALADPIISDSMPPPSGTSILRLASEHTVEKRILSSSSVAMPSLAARSGIEDTAACTTASPRVAHFRIARSSSANGALESRADPTDKADKARA